MKWLRSEEMEYMSLILNEDAAHDTIQKLGDLGVIEFTDVSDGSTETTLPHRVLLPVKWGINTVSASICELCTTL